MRSKTMLSMVGGLALPIMMSLGVPRKLSGVLFLLAFALGLIFNITGTIVNGAVGIGAGSVRKLFKANASAARRLGYLSGTVFLALAAKLAFEQR